MTVIAAAKTNVEQGEEHDRDLGTSWSARRFRNIWPCPNLGALALNEWGQEDRAIAQRKGK